jgi:WD40 repeat protein
LFGDQYHLGEVLFGNPWESICQRSPDGSWVAFVSRPVNKSDSDSALRWFHLSNPEKSFRTLSTQLGVTGFAFSPDNTRLAYFARPSSRGMGTLGVVDLETGQDQPLLIIGDVNSLVWDPEGKYLAMIARYDSGSYLENVSVIDVDHQKITYNASIDVLSNAVGDWPMLDWGVEFPVEMNRMDECALPPSS